MSASLTLVTIIYPCGKRVLSHFPLGFLPRHFPSYNEQRVSGPSKRTLLLSACVASRLGRTRQAGSLITPALRLGGAFRRGTTDLPLAGDPHPTASA